LIGTAGGLVVYIRNADDSAAEFFNRLKPARDLGSRQPAVETRRLRLYASIFEIAPVELSRTVG